MIKKTILSLIVLLGFESQAQVGINTTTPKAQLEIKSSNETTPANTDGLLIPKINAFPVTNPTADQQGMLVYLTTTVGSNVPGFYYWNNPSSTWISIGNNNNSGWNLTGNTGTNSNTNFIGTTDNQDLVIKQFNIQSGRISETNTFLGRASGLLSTGFNNTFLGARAGRNNASGTQNVMIGLDSGSFGTSGTNNVFVGMSSGNSNNADQNTFVGSFSGMQNSTGLNNSFFGTTSGLSNTSGGFNTFIGAFAGENNTTGIRNTMLGSNANVGTNNLTNATAIGFNAHVNSSNAMVLGSINGVNGATSSVNVGIGTATPSRRLHVANGESGAASSTNTGIVLESNTNVYQHFLTPSTAENGLLFGTDLNSIGSSIIYNNVSNTDGFQFRTGGNFTRMTLTNTGNLGIGTVSPARRLHVANGSSGATSNANAGVVVESNANVFQHFLTPFTAENGLLFGTDTNSIGSGLIFNNASTLNGLQFRTGGNFTRMTLTGGGNLGIGTVTPLDRLHIVGNIRIEDGTQGAGKILTSDVNGKAIWSTAGSIASGTLDQAYDFGGAGLGRTITADAGAVNIQGTGGLLVSGKTGLGTVTPVTDVEIVGNNVTTGPSTYGNLHIRTIDDFAADIGASISLGGMFGTASTRNFGTIEARKSTNNIFEQNAYLIFKTLGSGILSERMRITSNGDVGIGTSTPQSKLHVVGNLTIVDGNQALGKVLTSDANGTATWSTAGTIASGTLDQAYDFGGAGNGRTITADTGAVTINGTDGLVVTGTSGSGAIAPSGAGTRMVWYPRKAAFRAGNVSGTQWDDANIGLNSVAFGSSSRAAGTSSTAFGFSTLASGTSSTAFGSGTNASGDTSVAFGQSSSATGTYSFAGGFFSNATGSSSFAFGASSSADGFDSTSFGGNAKGDGTFTTGNANQAVGTFSNTIGSFNTASSYAETVIGIGATTYTPSVNGDTQFTTANATDRLFVIGNAIDVNNNGGIDVAERSDAIVVLKNGNTGIGNSTPSERLHVAGRTLLTNGFSADNAALLYRNNTDYMFLGPQSGSSSNGAAMALFGSANTSGGNAGGLDVNVPGGQVRMNHTNGSYNFSANSTSGYTGTFELNDSGFEIGNNSASRALIFSPNSAERMRLTPGGFLGIGTTSPARKLHVSNGVSGGTSNTNTGILLESSGAVYQHYLAPSTSESGMLFGSESASINGGIIFNNSIATNGIQFRTGGNTNRMTVTSAGDVGIGTTAPGGQFELSLNEGRKPGSNAWTIVSDQRLKNVNGIFNKGLNEIIQLNPIRYNYKNNGERKFEQQVLNTEFTGFLAQEVQQIFPEAVGTDADGYLNFDLHPILVAYTNAFKELNLKNQAVEDKNRELELKLKSQEQIINTLIERLEKLEAKN